MLIGIVGKPSTGKSTFFKAATLAEVAIAPHPFTTIKPNHAVGFVKTKCVEGEFNVKCTPRFGYCNNQNRFVPIDLIDVAGLIEGSHEGKGLGLSFLNDLNQSDTLIHHPKDRSDKDIKDLSRELRILTKPMIIAENKIDIRGSKLNLEQLQ